MGYSVNETIIFPSYSQLYHCVFWSEQNQISITTPETIYIISPCYPNLKQKGSPTPVEINLLPLQEYRPAIEEPPLQNALEHLKTKSLADSSFFIQLAMPLNYRMAIWTPRGCTLLGGCGLLVLYSDHQLVLFHPLSDPTRGKWGPCLHVSKLILKQLKEKNLSSNFISMDCTYHSKYDTLLALGSMLGEISIWRLSQHEVTLLDYYKDSHMEWITSLSWADQGRFLAFAKSDGSVKVLEIQEIPLFELKSIPSPYESDPRLASLLYWLSEHVLVIAKANTVCFWNLLECTKHEVELPSCSVISAMAPTTEKMAIHVFTMDGQMHFIDFVGDRCSIDPIESRNLHNLFFSNLKKGSLSTLKNEESNVNDEQVEENTLNDQVEDEEDGNLQPSNLHLGKKAMFLGAATSPNGLFTALFYGIHRPFDLYFRTEKGTGLLLDFLPTGSRECVGEIFPFLYSNSINATSENVELMNDYTPERALDPSYLFWDMVAFFLGSNNQFTSDSFYSTVSQFLQMDPSHRPTLLLQYAFFLTRHIPFNNDHLGTLLFKKYYYHVIDLLEDTFSQSMLDEIPLEFCSFLYRLSALSSLFSDPTVITRIQLLFQLSTPLSSSSNEGWVLHESCPVCKKPVKLALQNGVVNGICERSHSWKRCCFTFKILTSTQVRECLGCGLTLSSELSPISTLESSDPYTHFLTQLNNKSICYLCSDRFWWSGKLLNCIKIDD